VSGPVPLVSDVSFDVREGEAVGIVGESGCGKTITAMSILGLLPRDLAVEGDIFCRGRNLTASGRRLAEVRGKTIGLVTQEPMIGLTPTFRVGWQIAEAVRRHHRVSRSRARERTIELLRQVRLPDPETVARRFPHELSGGMAQRVAIARALAGEPELLIADEPTTALDVTVQGEILDLLRDLQEQRRMSVLLISHDWGVIADICDRVVVMYAGEVVETAPVATLFDQPRHPYTRALLASNPQHAPVADNRLPTIPGVVAKPGAWPSGCRFEPRCGFATAECGRAPIAFDETGEGRGARCIHHERLARLPNGELRAIQTTATILETEQ
jgi:peptide/nickel transport system permease protein